MAYSILLILVSGILIFLGITGRRFSAGLASRTPLPMWQGRVWFVALGSFLLLTGIVGLAPRLGLGQGAVGYLRRLTSYSNLSIDLLLALGAVVLVVVACFQLSAVAKKKGDRKELLLGLVLLIAGILFLWSTVVSLASR